MRGAPVVEGDRHVQAYHMFVGQLALATVRVEDPDDRSSG
jgi:hypothetical protein